MQIIFAKPINSNTETCQNLQAQTQKPAKTYRTQTHKPAKTYRTQTQRLELKRRNLPKPILKLKRRNLPKPTISKHHSCQNLHAQTPIAAKTSKTQTQKPAKTSKTQTPKPQSQHPRPAKTYELKP